MTIFTASVDSVTSIKQTTGSADVVNVAPQISDIFIIYTFARYWLLSLAIKSIYIKIYSWQMP